MMEHKRGPVSVEQGSLSSLAPKRHKAEMSISSKERKDKVGERIAALQQLVSPYGKTDTASVLLEAMGYINFLHEQVKVLSAPYLHCTSTTNLQVDLNFPPTTRASAEAKKSHYTAELLQLRVKESEKRLSLEKIMEHHWTDPMGSH